MGEWENLTWAVGATVKAMVELGALISELRLVDCSYFRDEDADLLRRSIPDVKVVWDGREEGFEPY